MKIIRRDLAQMLEEKLIWSPPRITLQTVDGDKVDIYGRMNVVIKFGNPAFLHAVYVANITFTFADWTFFRTMVLG